MSERECASACRRWVAATGAWRPARRRWQDMQGSTKVTGFIIAIAIAVAMLGTSCIISSDDDDSTITVENQSSYVIEEVRVAAVGVDTWGPNLIPGALFPGESVTISVDCDTYDVLIVDETGLDCTLVGLDLCFEDGTWVVTDGTLNQCAFGAR